MKKNTKTILFVILGALLCIVCLWALLYFTANPYTKVIGKNWGIELPSAGAKDIFSYSEPSPHGDGIRYHVIDYPAGSETKKMQSTTFGLEKLFVHSQPPAAEQIAYVNRLLEKIDVPDELIPDWSACALLCQKKDDGSELFLFYRSETGTLYVVESFI